MGVRDGWARRAGAARRDRRGGGARGLREFTPQELANTAWAYATAGHAAPALLDAIAEEAAARAARVQAAGARQHGVGVRDGRHAAPALLDAIAEEAARRGLRDFKPQELANTAWAYATAGHAAPALLDAIAEEAAGRGLRDFKPQELANTAWAYATAGHAAPALLDAIAEEAARRGLRDFKPQGLANTAWAYAAADRPAPALFGGDAFVQRCAAERGFEPEDLCQLHQWQLWQEERGAAWPPLPPALAQRCRDAFCQEEGAPSRLQRDVAASLARWGWRRERRCARRRATAWTRWSRTAGARWRWRWTARRTFWGRTPTGATALKRRQLRAAGWALLPVPYWEWNALGSEAAKQEYLQGGLRAALASRRDLG